MMTNKSTTQGKPMDDHTTPSRRWLKTILVCAGIAAFVMPQMAQSQSAADVGVTQPPVVTVLFGTSSSMQYAEGGLGDYPYLSDSDAPDSSRHIEEWAPGEELNLPGSRRYDGQSLQPVDSDDYIRTVGPCAVWHPIEFGGTEATCGEYQRPASESCPAGTPWEGGGPPGIPPGQVPQDCEFFDWPHPSESQGLWDDDGMLDVMTMMAGNPNMRLDDANSPRHIQIKQILTGGMELGGEEGPGCWFVPRFRDALNEEQICCAEVDDNGQCAGDGADEFAKLIDHRDSIPHFQEVYDNQRDDGLLDLLGSTAIFSAASVDGFPFDGSTYTDWEYPINDIMASDLLAEQNAQGYNNLNTRCLTESGLDCHQTGLFRYIGPRDYKIDDGDLTEVSNYVQEAILDAGFLIHDQDEDDNILGIDDVLDDGEELEDDVSMFEYPMHRQPMGGGSPFGPVFHDLHRFYVDGQYNSLEDVDDNNFSNPNTQQQDVTDANPTPPEGDPYASCRARHAVLFTDGVPQPEAAGGAGDELGYAQLEFGAGGFDEDRFPYIPAEDAIGEMLDAVESGVMGGDVEPEFLPRVHIVGANIEDQIQLAGPEDEQEESDLRERALEKVGAMASAGRTCAQYYLPPDMVAEGYRTGPEHEEDGQCDLDDPDQVCLVPQVPESSQQNAWGFMPPEEGATEFDCWAPALVLTDNSREAVRDAFWMIFTEIAGMSGLSAQTAPSMTSYLDHPTVEQGQYRIFSGFEVTSGNNHYKGLLNRQLLTCDQGALTSEHVDDCDDDDLRCLHEDMLRLRENVHANSDDPGEGGEVDGDRRRVFTSVPEFLVRYEDPGDDDTDLLGNDGGPAGNFLNYTYTLQDTIHDTFGEFNITGLDAEAFDNRNTRVSFDATTIRSTFDDLGVEDDDNFYDYWNVSGVGDDEEMFEQMFEVYRGLIEDRQDRVLGPISRSNPVTVGPPDLDLPIDSYRQFRRAHDQRPTMTYTSTVDGQLRAIHTGEPSNVMVQTEINEADGRMHDGGSERGDAADQREAWAYVPQLVHRNLFDAQDGSTLDGLMDGSPVVTDIRLCQGGGPWSANSRVCPSGNDVPGAAQWRTVLVQGMGLAGNGYFALDITRSGATDSDEAKMPDPIPMWEFGPEWEMLQTMQADDAEDRFGPTRSELEDFDDDDDLYDACEDAMDDEDDHFEEYFGDEVEDVWKLSFLGSTVGEPAVGTVNFRTGDGDRVQRPVAIFGGGTSANTEAPLPFSNRNLGDCIDYITGRAIYVVDLQSGEMIRRFVDFDDNGSGRDRFRGEVTGTPVLSGNSPGDVSTRGFIGDEQGRMFRIDMTEDRPADWDVELFFDPAEKVSEPGPAAYRPAVTTTADRQLILIYGLARRGETGGNMDDQAIFAVRERLSFEESNSGQLMWFEEFEPLEQLTGAPLVFGGDVYFTTYVEDSDDRCAGGLARIYRMAHDGVDPEEPNADNEEGHGKWDPENDLDEFDNIFIDNDNKWFGPSEPTLIRGMAVTMGPACELSGQTDAMGESRQPQLVAQTGDADVGGGNGNGDVGTGTGGGQVGGMGQVSVDIDPPETQSIPLSWSVIEN